MKSPARTSRSAPRRRGHDPGARRRLSRLLDDDHVGGLLSRIRAVGCLIGVGSEVDPAQISVAGWLVEALAGEAQERLAAEVEGQARGKAASRRRHF